LQNKYIIAIIIITKTSVAMKKIIKLNTVCCKQWRQNIHEAAKNLTCFWSHGNYDDNDSVNRSSL